MALTFRTKYSPEECVARLRESLAAESKRLLDRSGWTAHPLIVGSVEEHEFEIERNHHSRSAAPFSRTFRGRLIADGDAGRGTRIEGDFVRQGRRQWHLYSFWFGVFLLSVAVAQSVIISGFEAATGFTAVMTVIWVISYLDTACDDEDHIISFIAHSLDAEVPRRAR